MLCRNKWQPTPVSCLENPMDGGVWWATVIGLQRIRHDLMTEDTHTCYFCQFYHFIPYLKVSTESKKLIQCIL